MILNKLVIQSKLDSGQGGFRAGFSTTGQVMLAEQARYVGSRLFVFLDLEAAYDRVQIHLLLVKMSKMGFDNWLIKLIDSLFTSCKSRVMVNGVLTPAIDRQRGLFQGSLLSPSLFNVFINDLASLINSSNRMDGLPCCLLFADDILLHSNDTTRMRVMLKSVDLWCHENGMRVNVPKCGTFTSCKLLIGGTAIPIVKFYKYLGVPIGPGGILVEQHLEDQLGKAGSLLSGIRNSPFGRMWTPLERLEAYLVYIRPVYEYMAPVVYSAICLSKAQTLWNILEKFQYKCLKWVLGTKCPKRVGRAICGLKSVEYRFTELIAMFSIKLTDLPSGHPLRQWIINPGYQCPIIRKITDQLPRDGAEDVRDRFQELAMTDNSSSRLGCLIARESLDEHHRDGCLFIQEPLLRRLAIQWRCNTFGVYGTCQVCGEKFTRNHVSTCFTVHLSRARRTEFDAMKIRLNPGSSLNELDYLLNKGEYKLFKRAILDIKSGISQGVGGCDSTHQPIECESQDSVPPLSDRNDALLAFGSGSAATLFAG